ncbi:thiamine phosphate synthase [Crassaminicella profunda]|uniref:thiamine phosphate synthase n=1 Tax=Crassaminicella profunda TaxID=1286698 RepID=UPI001CA68C5A|nr:thiamine phosphate synthase [Crassaminicella profunda]QZY55305.1 thiamine phosphate synthase [Crassaminicella profunda]
MLFLITNRKIIKKGTFIEVIKKAVAGGVEGVILREKDLTYDELLPIAQEIKKITKEKNILLIINRNLEVAKTVGAEGFHIGFHDLMIGKPDWEGRLGVSVHSLEEAILAEKNGADYLLASHVYATDCKKGLAPRGVNFIKEIKENVNIPVIALGGINPENTREVLSTGIEGIAVMSSIMAVEDPCAAAQMFKNKIGSV